MSGDNFVPQSHQKGNSPQPIRLTLGRSRYLALALLVAHGGALLCLAAIDAPWPVTFLVGAIIVFSLFVTLHEHALRTSRSAITALSWTTEGVWKLWRRDGKSVSLLEPEEPVSRRRLFGRQIFFRRTRGVRAYVHPHLVVLHFPTEKGFGRSVVLHTGMVDDRDGFRRLRIRLRFLPAADGAASGTGK